MESLNIDKIVSKDKRNSRLNRKIFCTGSVETRDFLKTILDEDSSLDKNELKLYQNFIIKFLHTIVSKLKTVQDDEQIKEIGQACIVCCETYLKLQNGLEVDKAFTVPKLVYHIIAALKKQEYIPEVISLSDLMYRMVSADHGPLSTDVNTLISAIVASIWNTSSKLARQTTPDAIVPIDQVLKLWKTCFLFMCLQSDKSAMVDKLRTVMSEFLTSAKLEELSKQGPTCSEHIDNVFKSVIEKMENILKHIEKPGDKDTLSTQIIQVKSLYIEHLLRQSEFSNAQDIILAVNVGSSLSLIVSKMYEVCGHIMSKKSDYAKSAEILKQTNDGALKLCESGDLESVKILNLTYNYFTKLSQLELIIADPKSLILSEHCIRAFDVSCVTCSKVMGTYSEEELCKDQKKDNQHMRLFFSMLRCYYKQLHIISAILRNMEDYSSSDLVQKSLALAHDYSEWFEKDPCALSREDSIGPYRYNCGLICFSVGKLYIKKGMYSEAAELYEIVIKHLTHCQEPKLLKIMESLLECYIQLDKLTDASRVVVQILMTAGEAWADHVLLWYKLKKDAIAKGNEMFKTMLLREVVDNSGVELPNVTDRQLLQAEYQAWKKASRRNLDIEFFILEHLCEDKSCSKVEQAENMIDLASNMCHSDYLYDDSEAGEHLNKAIIILDKMPDKAGALLALAFHTKYIISHEQAIKEQSKVSSVGEDGVQNDGVESQTDVAKSETHQTYSKYTFTLELEQSYFPYLTRAVDLWEDWFSGAAKQRASKKRKTKAAKDQPEIVLDLEQHIASLVECSTSLILMKQPILALRALTTARSQLDNLPSGRQKEGLQLQMARMWVLLGQVQEAESLIPNCDTPTKKDSQPILQAELCMIRGKKKEGLDLLNKVLDNPTNQPLTQQMFLLDGTAKRLLSMFLCFPDSQAVNTSNQHLLYLAYEAVRSHISVLKSVVKNDTDVQLRSVRVDKCLLLHDILQSLLHLCQLCRFVGLPTDAQFYLSEGLQISQNFGIPRWSCEFLFEMLRVQALIGDFETAMSTVDLIYSMLDPQPAQVETAKSKLSVNKAGNKVESKSDIQNKSETDNAGSSDSKCFGFEGLDNGTKKTSVTPDKECFSQKLDSAQKQKISRLSAPVCVCMKNKTKCEDHIRHRLCMKAGLVLAEFFTQVDMRSTAEKILDDSKSVVVQSSMEKDMSLIDTIMQEVTPVNNGHLSDPQLIYLCLEACCIEAEMFLYQNNYEKVHEIWQTLWEIQEAGYLNNVLHSNVVMTRLALCDVNAHMKSSVNGLTRLGVKSADFTTSLISPLTEELDKLNLKEKKVSFFDNNSLSVEGEKLTGARRKLEVDTSGNKHEKSKGSSTVCENDNLTSPKASVVADEFITTPSIIKLSKMSSKSAKKDALAHVLQTPVSSRMAVLNCLMDSDSDHDQDVMFPSLKPVTPKVTTAKKQTKSTKAKTEPRNRRGKQKSEVTPYPVCKLDDVLKADESLRETSNADTSNTNKSSDVKNNKECVDETVTRKSIDDDSGSKDLSVDGQKMTISEKTTSRGRGRKKATEKVTIVKVGKKVRISSKDVEDIKDHSDAVQEETIENKTPIVHDKSCTDSKALKTSNVQKPAVNQDIYDFIAGDSPIVSKIQKGKNAKTDTKTKVSKIPKSKGKENDTVEKAPVKVRRGRSRQQGDVVEVQRRVTEGQLKTLDISYEEIDDLSDVEEDEVLELSIDEDVLTITEPISVQHVNKTGESNLVEQLHTMEEVDVDFEPIETMRGDPEPKSNKRSTRTGRKTNKKASVGGEESEVMRSGCPVSLKALSEKMQRQSNMEVAEEVPQASTDVSPGGDLNLSRVSVISSLEMMYEQIRHLAWYPHYPEICQVLALHYMDTDPWRAAFLLMDSLAVTFRHRAMLNVGRKVRKQKKVQACDKTVQQSGDNLACIKDGLLFDKDETSLKDMVSVIPANWVVVQLSVVSASSTGQQFVLTRFVNDQTPLVVRLPGFSTPQGRQILKDFSQILEGNKDSMKITTRTEWWKAREKLDLDLQTLIDNMQKFWIGPWKGPFMPREYSSQLVAKIVQEVKKAVKKDLDPAHIEVLLLSVDRVSDQQLVQCAIELLKTQCNLADIETVVSVVLRLAKPDVTDTHNHHVILILDKNIQQLPWECITTMRTMSVSRVPCLSHLYTVLTYLRPQKTSVVHKGVNPRDTYYIINPDLDLPHLEKTFKEWFEGEAGWKGVCGVRPTKEQFTEALTKRDLLIYCGHGSGSRYFGRDEIENLQGRAVSLLMGCSSGRLCARGGLEPSGIMLSYFMAGCPCMVANLWDVTDKDIDKYTYDLLKEWLNAEDGAYLSTQVQKSRQACKLKYLVGCAPVMYGLPVFLNRKTS